MLHHHLVKVMLVVVEVVVELTHFAVVVAVVELAEPVAIPGMSQLLMIIKMVVTVVLVWVLQSQVHL